MRFCISTLGETVVEVHWCGRFCSEATLECFSTLIQLTPRTAICDVRKTNFNVPSVEVIATARVLSERLGKTPLMLIILAEPGLSFGMMRMFTSLLGQRSEEIQFCDTLEEAFALANLPGPKTA